MVGTRCFTMCMMNATVRPDPSGNRKLDKQRSRGRTFQTAPWR